MTPRWIMANDGSPPWPTAHLQRYIRDFQILDLPDAPPAGVVEGTGPQARRVAARRRLADRELSTTRCSSSARTRPSRVWFSLVLHEVTSVVRGDMLHGGLVFEDRGSRRVTDATAIPRPGRWRARRRIDRRAPPTRPWPTPWAGSAPGHYHVATVFPPRFGEGDEFYHALLRWNASRAPRKRLSSIVSSTSWPPCPRRTS
jgi:hypothetical protein